MLTRVAFLRKEVTLWFVAHQGTETGSVSMTYRPIPTHFQLWLYYWFIIVTKISMQLHDDSRPCNVVLPS